MTNLETNRPTREAMTGWETIASGDNDVEILQHRIRVADFSQAADVANKIAPLVMQYEPLDGDYTVHVNLRQSVVEVTLTVPKEHWASDGQKNLAMGIIGLYDND